MRSNRTLLPADKTCTHHQLSQSVKKKRVFDLLKGLKENVELHETVLSQVSTLVPDMDAKRFQIVIAQEKCFLQRKR